MASNDLDLLHHFGEYFKGRDITERQMTDYAGPVTMSKNDILHELGDYWKGRLAALINHDIQHHIQHISHLISNIK
jgi:predicted Zn-dependent protease with MMP-like domain